MKELLVLLVFFLFSIAISKSTKAVSLTEFNQMLLDSLMEGMDEDRETEYIEPSRIDPHSNKKIFGFTERDVDYYLDKYEEE